MIEFYNGDLVHALCSIRIWCDKRTRMFTIYYRLCRTVDNHIIWVVISSCRRL